MAGNRHVEVVKFNLEELEEYFSEREDADCEGDPPRYVPNREMRLHQSVREIRSALKKLLQEDDWE